MVLGIGRYKLIKIKLQVSSQYNAQLESVKKPPLLYQI